VDVNRNFLRPIIYSLRIYTRGFQSNKSASSYRLGFLICKVYSCWLHSSHIHRMCISQTNQHGTRDRDHPQCICHMHQM